MKWMVNRWYTIYTNWVDKTIARFVYRVRHFPPHVVQYCILIVCVRCISRHALLLTSSSELLLTKLNFRSFSRNRTANVGTLFASFDSETSSLATEHVLAIDGSSVVSDGSVAGVDFCFNLLRNDLLRLVKNLFVFEKVSVSDSDSFESPTSTSSAILRSLQAFELHSYRHSTSPSWSEATVKCSTSATITDALDCLQVSFASSSSSSSGRASVAVATVWILQIG